MCVEKAAVTLSFEHCVLLLVFALSFSTVLCSNLLALVGVWEGFAHDGGQSFERRQ